MMEENPKLTHRCNLTSMSDKEFFELVWENGQLLMRNLPGRDQKSFSCNGLSSHNSSINAHLRVKNWGDTFPPKKSEFETLDSILGDSHHNNNFYLDLQVQDDDLHESWPELYGAHFPVFQEQYKGNNYDECEKDSQVVPVHEHENLKTGNTSNCFAETSQLAPTSQADRSSLKRQQESASLKRRSVNSRKNLVSMGELLDSKLQEQDLESDSKGLAGLSRADQELKNSDKRCSTPGGDNPWESMPFDPANGSKTLKGFGYQPNSSEAVGELSPRNAKPPDKSLQDNQSEADFRDDAFANKRSNNQVYGQTSKLAINKGKGEPTTQKSKELPVASSSLCSRGASNNPIYTLKRRYEDSEGSADEHPSKHIERKSKTLTKVVPGSKANRKRRATEGHNLSERRRRDKINKKMRALQGLIPNCDKVDKASILDEAIEYLKTLQLQVKTMSMGMPQMMLPAGLQQIHAPQMTNFSPMPMRMQMGLGCNPSNLLISQNPGGPAVPGAGMPGFPPQLLPMSVLPAPFVFGLFNTTVQIPGAPPTCAPMELMASATVSNSLHNINSERDKQC